MTTLTVRTTLAAALSTLVIACAVALTTTDASAGTTKFQGSGAGVGIGIGGARPPAYRCRYERIFFEGCWWQQTTCPKRPPQFRRLRCPDLR